MPSWMPDGSGTRARIGVLTPHLDAVPESEFQALAPSGVSIHAARIPLGMIGPDGQVIPKVDADIASAFAKPPAVDDATALLAAVEPDAIVFAFTSSSYIMGAPEDETLQRRLQKRSGNIPVVIQSAALATALCALGAIRISLVHPPWFSDELDALGAVYFRDRGFEVLRHGQAKLRDDYGDLTPALIYDWIMDRTPDATDAVVIAGGGFRATGAIGALETDLGIPVLSANQASFWLALRLSGFTESLTGYGRIFAEPKPTGM